MVLHPKRRRTRNAKLCRYDQKNKKNKNPNVVSCEGNPPPPPSSRMTANIFFFGEPKKRQKTKNLFNTREREQWIFKVVHSYFLASISSSVLLLVLVRHYCERMQGGVNTAHTNFHNNSKEQTEQRAKYYPRKKINIKEHAWE